MSYTPPAGNIVALPFQSTYTAPAGNNVAIPLADVLPYPTAIAESYATAYNTVLNVPAPGYLSNDTLNGATASLTSGTSNGVLTFNTDGSFSYSPNPTFHGTDSFVYKLTNTWGDSSTTVTLTVVPLPPTVRYQYADPRFPWGVSPKKTASVFTPFARVPALLKISEASWNHGDFVHFECLWAWTLVPRVVRSATLPWTKADSIQSSTLSGWRRIPRVQKHPSMRWGIPPVLIASTDIRFGHPPAVRATASFPWGIPPVISVASNLRLHTAPRKRYRERLRWGKGKIIQWIPHEPGVSPPGDTGDPPFYNPPPGNRVPIPFLCEWADRPGNQIPIYFGIGTCYGELQHPRSYVITNTVTVVRLPERTPIPVSSMTIAANVDGPYWSVQNMQLADPSFLSYLQKTADGPREIEVNVNGWVFTFIIEDKDESRQFVQRSVSVSGRSRTARLAEPNAPSRAYVEDDDRLSVQLMDSELELLYSDFSIDHQELSWTVPGGAWYYSDLTPMAAIQAIAAASGSIVQSDPWDKVLHIIPRYPASPWNWGTTGATKTVMDDFVRNVNYSDKSLPLYNYVFVSGTGVGVADPIIRDGSAGDIKAPMVTDQLITEHPASLERGRNVLSNRGEQSVVSVQIPLFPASGRPPGTPGLILIGELVNYISADESWKGLNIGTSISIDTSGDGLLEVWVTNQLERHYSDES